MRSGLVVLCCVAAVGKKSEDQTGLVVLGWRKKKAGGGGRAGSGRSRFPLHNGTGTHECQREERRKRGGREGLGRVWVARVVCEDGSVTAQGGEGACLLSVRLAGWQAG